MFFRKSRVRYLGQFRDEIVRLLRERGVTMVRSEGSSYTTSKGPFTHARIHLEMREYSLMLGCWVEILTDGYTDRIPSEIPLVHPNRLYPYLAVCTIRGDSSVQTDYPLTSAGRVAQRLFEQATQIQSANMKAREPEFLRRCEEARQMHCRAFEAVRHLAGEVRAVVTE